MSEKRFKQFGLWIIDDTNSNVNSVADLIDTKLMSTNEVVDLLNEQQATIRRLQDLCGESDGENAKLRIKNKEQQATIERLQKKIDNISNSYEKFYGVKLKYAHWLQGDD